MPDTSADYPLSHSEWKEQKKPKLKWPVDVLCDRTQIPANAGQIIRSADGLSINRVLFLRPQFSWKPKQIHKISRSALQYVDIKLIENIEEIDLSIYKNIVALEYTKQSCSIYEKEISGSTLLILGSEFDGISIPLLNKSDIKIHIPLFGKQSSLNVAQACTAAAVYLNKYRIE